MRVFISLVGHDSPSPSPHLTELPENPRMHLSITGELRLLSHDDEIGLPRNRTGWTAAERSPENRRPWPIDA
jgi:hypothetical protein